MNKIFSLFEENSLTRFLSDYPNLVEIDYLVWYPSSGYDYRHILDDISKDDTSDKIYLHSDILALNRNFDNSSNHNPILIQGNFKGQYAISLYCENVYQLTLKQDMYFPCKDVLYRGSENKSGNNGKVFCCIINEINNPKKPIPLLFFGYENTNLFYDYLLANDIKIEELIHINDGGHSMGESKYKMDYIYLFVNELGIKKIKLDYDIATKMNHACSDFGHFRYYNPLSRNEGYSHLKEKWHDKYELLEEFEASWEETNAINRNLLNQKLKQYIGTNMYQFYREKSQFDYLYIKA